MITIIRKIQMRTMVTSAMKFQMKRLTVAAVCCGLLLAAATTNAAEVTDSYYKPFVKATKGKWVVASLADTNTDLTIIWDKIFRENFETLGINYEVRDANWNSNAQTQAVEALIIAKKKPDVLIVQNWDLALLAKQLRRAEKVGIKVIQLNMRSRADTDAYVGANWIEIGRTVAKELVEACSPQNKKSGKVALIQGEVTAADSYFQMIGINEILADNPQIDVVLNQGTSWDTSKAHDIALTVLQQHDDLCAIYGFWDGHHVGAAEAIKESGKQGKVLSLTNGAGHRSACNSIKSGLVDIYWSYDAPRQASDVVTMALALMQNGAAAGSSHIAIYTPLTKITKENLYPEMCFDTPK
jgi:ABC-type sugar transport system substrate-binding protein